MTTVSFDVPEESLRAVGVTPEGFGRAVRLAAAMFWYGRSEVTLGSATALAGLSQTAFIRELKENKQDTFVVDFTDLDRELAFLAERRSQGSASG